MKTDVLVTVPHKNYLNIQTKPLLVARDSEVKVEEIAKSLAKKADVSVLINNSVTDVNTAPNFFEFDEANKKEFFDIVEELNPRLVIDLHGSADVGVLFNNAVNHGYRYFRDFREKKQVGPRPQIDIEFRRKAGLATSNGHIPLMLGTVLAKFGFIVGFERVFPGGYLIQRVSNMHRNAIALEITRQVREDSQLRSKLVSAIETFVKIFRGEKVTELIDINNFMDYEKIYQNTMKEFQKFIQRQGQHMGYIG